MKSQYLEFGAGLVLAGTVLNGCSEERKSPMADPIYNPEPQAAHPEISVEGGPVIELDISNSIPKDQGIKVTQESVRAAIKLFNELKNSHDIHFGGDTNCGIHEMNFIQGELTKPRAVAYCPEFSTAFSVIQMTKAEYSNFTGNEGLTLYYVHQEKDGTITIENTSKSK